MGQNQFTAWQKTRSEAGYDILGFIHNAINFYSSPVGVRSIVINPSLCLCVGQSASISLEPVD